MKAHPCPEAINDNKGCNNDNAVMHFVRASAAIVPNDLASLLSVLSARRKQWAARQRE